jgi:hypothetical protein
MAPSNVPTNWQKVLEGIDAAMEDEPSLGQEVERALVEMGAADPESVYAALLTLLNYMDLEKFLVRLKIDPRAVASAIRRRWLAVESAARGGRPQWLAKDDGDLWERMNWIAGVAENEYGLPVR